MLDDCVIAKTRSNAKSFPMTVSALKMTLRSLPSVIQGILFFAVAQSFSGQ